MPSRLELQTLLETILNSENVYFQAPSSDMMQYPCIIYKLDGYPSKFANNKPYKSERRYMITVIAANPDTTLVDEMVKLPKCSFDRHYVADNLNHWVFIMFY